MLNLKIFQNQKTKKPNSEDTYIIIPVFEQIGENLKLIIESSDPSKYKTIIDSIFRHLNYKEIESLLDSIKDNLNWPIFLSEFNKEKHVLEEAIESLYLNQVDEARLSLCTSDFMAYIIGKKYDIQDKLNKNSIWSEVYKTINKELNGYLLREKVLCIEESDKKAHVPINYALSMFFLHDKKTATTKFKRILSDDRENRLEALHEAEYFLITEKFFSRLKLDFIPQINLFSDLDQINFENNKNQYITRDELRILYDREDYFNKRVFSVDIKKLLNPRNISNKELLVESYILFFESIDNQFDRKNIDILISCFTEKNPKYEEIEIINARCTLNNLLHNSNKKTDFIVLNYYLSQRDVFYESMNNLAYLLDIFFNNVHGMRFDTIKGLFYGKKIVDIDKAISIELKDYIKKNT
jgi:hypothetical protein